MAKAKVLTEEQIQKAITNAHYRSHHPDRDILYLLLSHRLGLRAQEIAYLHVEDITDVEGNITNTLHVSKRSGKYGKERALPLPNYLREALAYYMMQ